MKADFLCYFILFVTLSGILNLYKSTSSLIIIYPLLKVELPLVIFFPALHMISDFITTANIQQIFLSLQL